MRTTKFYEHAQDIRTYAQAHTCSLQDAYQDWLQEDEVSSEYMEGVANELDVESPADKRSQQDDMFDAFY